MSDDRGKGPTRILQILDDAERFEYRPDTLPDVVIGYRRLTGDAIREIDLKYQKVDYKRGRQIYVPDDRQRDRIMDIWDHIVLDWTPTVVGKDQQPVPCTRENKYKLPGKTKAELLELADTDDVSDLRGGAGSPNS